MHGFEGTPFVLELCREYLYWSSFFDQKHKKQFIQTPLYVMDIRVKSLTHLKEVEREFEGCEFIEGLVVQGFDLEGICVSNLNFMGYHQYL